MPDGSFGFARDEGKGQGAPPGVAVLLDVAPVREIECSAALQGGIFGTRVGEKQDAGLKPGATRTSQTKKPSQ